MGNRPYYIISYTRDYDGYETFIEYVGTNYKAALDRYVALVNYIKQRDFLDCGIEEDRIDMRVDIPQTPLQPGHRTYAYINDNDCGYMTGELRFVNTNRFLTSTFEEKYKATHPNSKY